MRQDVEYKQLTHDEFSELVRLWYYDRSFQNFKILHYREFEPNVLGITRALKILKNTYFDGRYKLIVEQPLEINVNVNVEFKLKSIDIAASNTLDVSEVKLDDQAESDYLAFVANILGAFLHDGFEILESSDSKQSETSKYFTLALKEDFNNDEVKAFISIQIN